MKNPILRSRKAIVQIPLIAAVVGAIAVIGLIAQDIATEVSLSQPPKTPRIDRLLASLEEAVNVPAQPTEPASQPSSEPQLTQPQPVQQEIQPTQSTEQPATLSEPNKEVEKKPLPQIIKTEQGIEKVMEEERPEEEFVDPREIKDVQRQLKDLKREVNRLKTRAKKVPNGQEYINKLNEILEKVNTFTTSIKNEPTRDNLQSFYDERLWDEMNSIRALVEIPQEIAQIGKELKKMDRLLKGSTFKKTGLDLEKIRGYLEEVRTALNEAKGKLDEGNAEEAMEALEPIHEGMHPGEIGCVLYAFRDLMREMPRNAEIRAQLEEVLLPIREAVAEGDFRDACRTLNEVRDEMMKIMRYSIKKGLPPQMQEKLNKLQGLMEQKFGGGGESMETPAKEVPVEKQGNF